MTTRKAHEIKPGDRIRGVEVFGTIRRTFGGFYIPMADGSRLRVASLDAPVTTDEPEHFQISSTEPQP